MRNRASTSRSKWTWFATLTSSFKGKEEIKAADAGNRTLIAEAGSRAIIPNLLKYQIT
jgi:hypothetical protein